MKKLCLSLLLLVTACGPATDEGATPALCAHDPPLSYNNFGRAFLEQNCTGCHHSLLPPDERNGAPVGVDLDTYESVLTWSDRIAARSLGESPSMPPAGGILAEDLALLEEWLGCKVAQDVAALEGTPSP